MKSIQIQGMQKAMRYCFLLILPFFISFFFMGGPSGCSGGLSGPGQEAGQTSSGGVDQTGIQQGPSDTTASEKAISLVDSPTAIFDMFEGTKFLPASNVKVFVNTRAIFNSAFFSSNLAASSKYADLQKDVEKFIKPIDSINWIMVACNNSAMCEGGDQNNNGFFDNCKPLIVAGDTNAVAKDISANLTSDGWSCSQAAPIICTKTDEKKTIELIQLASDSVLLYGSNDIGELDIAAGAFSTGIADISVFPSNFFVVGVADLEPKCTENLNFIKGDQAMTNRANVIVLSDIYFEVVIADFANNVFLGRNHLVLNNAGIDTDKAVEFVKKAFSGPKVDYTEPPNNATGVDPASPIVVVFKASIDKNTVNKDTFLVKYHDDSGDHDVTSPSISSLSGTTFEFSPPAPSFILNTQYFVTIKGGPHGVKDDAFGNGMSDDYNWFFTTKCQMGNDPCGRDKDCCESFWCDDTNQCAGCIGGDFPCTRPDQCCSHNCTCTTPDTCACGM